MTKMSAINPPPLLGGTSLSLMLFVCLLIRSPSEGEARMSQEVPFCDRNVEASRVSRLLVLRQKLQVAAIQFCKNILNYQQIMKKVQFSSGKICWPSTRRKNG